MTYSVNLYGSHPDNNNDDCWTGTDFATEREARACFNNPWSTFKARGNRTCTQYFELTGPLVYEVRKNPDFVKSVDSFDDERHEAAMQAGMSGGCEAYNEVMGWD